MRRSYETRGATRFWQLSLLALVCTSPHTHVHGPARHQANHEFRGFPASYPMGFKTFWLWDSTGFQPRRSAEYNWGLHVVLIVATGGLEGACTRMLHREKWLAG